MMNLEVVLFFLVANASSIDIRPGGARFANRRLGARGLQPVICVVFILTLGVGNSSIIAAHLKIYVYIQHGPAGKNSPNEN